MRAADLLESACGVGIRYRRRGGSTAIPSIHYRTSTAHGPLDESTVVVARFPELIALKAHDASS
jgi:hypothetical protein